jgi:hypothetical protein
MPATPEVIWRAMAPVAVVLNPTGILHAEERTAAFQRSVAKIPDERLFSGVRRHALVYLENVGSQFLSLRHRPHTHKPASILPTIEGEVASPFGSGRV